jgi:hypothetical protein
MILLHRVHWIESVPGRETIRELREHLVKRDLALAGTERSCTVFILAY